MRPESEESKYRAGRRKQYFENPKYRKWSDIMDKTNRSYGTYRERAFLRLYLDCNEVSDNLSLSKMHETLANGKDQPIDWEAFYSYFDERMDDPDNPYAHEMEEELFSFMDDKISVINLINQYRDKLLSPNYDIV